MLAAHGDIAVVAADFGLRALAHCLAIGIDPQVHGGLAPAIAHGLHLHQRIGNAQQDGRTREKLALEIGPEAVAEHGNAGIVGQPREPPHLLPRQELRLVHQHAGELGLLVLFQNARLDIGVGFVAMRVAGQTDAARNGAEAGPVVQRGGPQ